MKVHGDDLWKVLGVLAGTVTFWAAHSDKIPAPLVAYKTWIETAAYVWALVQAQRMIPSNAVKVDGGK